MDDNNFERCAICSNAYLCTFADKTNVNGMDAMIDRFGTDVQTYACDRQNFRVIEEVAVGKVFFNLIFGFERKVRIP